MESSSDNDSDRSTDDTGSVSDFDDGDIVTGQHGRVDKVKVDDVKVELGESSCRKLGNENDGVDSFHPMLERAIRSSLQSACLTSL